VAGLRQKGVHVHKGETTAVDEFNKVQYFNQCLCNEGDKTSCGGKLASHGGD